LIRFERFDFDSFALGKPLYKFRSLVSSQALKDGFGRSDGEIVVVRVLHAIATGHRTREDVQAAPDGIDVGPGFDHEGERKRRLLDCYHDLVRNVRIRVAGSDFDVLF
jgi:hypothetical protein